MNLNTIKPIGPHVTGLIRFAAENQGTPDFRQLDYFEVLARAYEDPTDDGQPPKLKGHPIGVTLRDATNTADAKLRSIPVKVIFNDIGNNLSARYEAFDGQLNRMACVGDGEKCSRASFATGQIQEHACAGPDACEFANDEGVQCQLRVRLHLQIEGQPDPLSVFEFQSGGIHSYRALTAKLTMLRALMGGKLRGVPLSLVQYDQGSAAHKYQTFHVADLVLRNGVTPDDALSAAEAAEKSGGPDFGGMEAAVAQMRQNAPMALGDEVEGIVFLHNIAPAVRPRARPAQAEHQAMSGAKRIEDVVAVARKGALKDADEVAKLQTTPDAAAPLQGIDLGVAVQAHAPTSKGAAPHTDATISSSGEMAPTAL